MEIFNDVIKEQGDLFKNEILKRIFYCIIDIIAVIVAYMFFNRKNIIVVLGPFCAIFFLMQFIDVIVSRLTFPKCPKNKKGVLVIIDSQDENEYNDIKSKFFNNLVDKLKFKCENIKLELLDYKLNKKAEKIEVNKILKKTRCKFVLKIRECHEVLKDDIKYRAYIDLVGYSKNVDLLIKSCDNLFISKKIDFSKLDKIDKLEITSNDISLLVRYIISYIYILDRNYEECQNILEDLYNSIDNRTIMHNKRLNLVKIQVTLLNYIVSYIIATKIYDTYTLTNDVTLLGKVEKQLNNANKYIKDTYPYVELNSVIRFLKYRDAEYGINLYKSTKYKNIKSINKKFNLAFLESYIDSSEIRIVNLYIDSFKFFRKSKIYDDTYIYDIINFIEKNINEPEYFVSKLNLALALLYIEINNIEKFKLNMKEYMKKRNISNINPFAIVIIENRYNINLKKIIEDFKLR